MADSRRSRCNCRAFARLLTIEPRRGRRQRAFQLLVGLAHAAQDEREFLPVVLKLGGEVGSRFVDERAVPPHRHQAVERQRHDHADRDERDLDQDVPPPMARVRLRISLTDRRPRLPGISIALERR